MSVKIAVYGSLREGEYNYKRFKDKYKKGIKVLAKDVLLSGFEMYDLGDYPAAVNISEFPELKITTDILEVSDDCYLRIEAMELGAGYIDVHRVVTINGEDTIVKIFKMYKDQVQGMYERVDSGDWVKYKNKDVEAKRKIYIVGQTGHEYINWMEGKRVKTMEEADLIVFTGGEDVDPKLYGEEEGYKTYSNPERDRHEIKEYNKALKLGIPMAGICRGSQLLCVLNGGKLIQHMDHPGNHNITTNEGQVLIATSTHHQMQFPYGLPKEDYKLLAWAKELSHCHLDGNNAHIEFPAFAYYDGKMMEPEIVLYPKTKCLAIQMHPEYWGDDSKNPTIVYLRGLLNSLIESKGTEKVSAETEELPF